MWWIGSCRASEVKVDLLTYTMLQHELLHNQCGGGGFQEMWRCPRRQKAGGSSRSVVEVEI
jgi:hypothetical protein